MAYARLGVTVIETYSTAMRGQASAWRNTGNTAMRPENAATNARYEASRSGTRSRQPLVPRNLDVAGALGATATDAFMCASLGPAAPTHAPAPAPYLVNIHRERGNGNQPSGKMTVCSGCAGDLPSGSRRDPPLRGYL